MIQELKSIHILHGAEDDSIQELAKHSKVVSIEQGQILTRLDSIESNAFIILEGKVRCLAEAPFSKELFTVGEKSEGDFVGIVDFLRGHSCEATIAKTKCKLIAIPLVEIKRLSDAYSGFKNNIEKVESICEKAYALAAYARQMNKPPLDGKKWIIDKFKEKGQQKVRILSKDFDIKGWKTGMELKKEDLENMVGNMFRKR